MLSTPTRKHLFMRSALLKILNVTKIPAAGSSGKCRLHELVSLWHRYNIIRRMQSPNERLPNPLAQQVGREFCFTNHMDQRVKINTNVACVLQAYNGIPSHPRSTHVQRYRCWARPRNRPLLNFLLILWRKCKMKCYLFSLSAERPYLPSQFLTRGFYRHETLIPGAIYTQRQNMTFHCF